jgi:hypothetical protein
VRSKRYDSCEGLIDPLQLEVQREKDGRFRASVPELTGVMAYGDTEKSAVGRMKRQEAYPIMAASSPGSSIASHAGIATADAATLDKSSR